VIHFVRNLSIGRALSEPPRRKLSARSAPERKVPRLFRPLARRADKRLAPFPPPLAPSSSSRRTPIAKYPLDVSARRRSRSLDDGHRVLYLPQIHAAITTTKEPIYSSRQRRRRIRPPFVLSSLPPALQIDCCMSIRYLRRYTRWISVSLEILWSSLEFSGLVEFRLPDLFSNITFSQSFGDRYFI